MSGQTLNLVPTPCGLFGKAPTAGDFLRLYLSATVAETLDTWLSAALTDLAATTPDWQDSFRRAETWRFVITPDVAGSAPLAGVIGPSQDRIGRAFPCMAVSTLRDVDALAAVACTPWFDSAETLLNDAVSGAHDLDQINRALQALASPRSDDLDVLSLKGRSTDDGLFLDVRSGPDGRAVTMQAVLETAPLAPLTSLWWRHTGFGAKVLLTPGLPVRSAFGALFYAEDPSERRSAS